MNSTRLVWSAVEVIIPNTVEKNLKVEQLQVFVVQIEYSHS
jgi:hypothetical protein